MPYFIFLKGLAGRAGIINTSVNNATKKFKMKRTGIIPMSYHDGKGEWFDDCVVYYNNDQINIDEVESNLLVQLKRNELYHGEIRSTLVYNGASMIHY